MIETLQFFIAPVLMAALLVAIHAYLGLHVLEREVIFVDISLSQVAALGGAIALFFADEDNKTVAILFSLGLCLLTALGLSLLRHFEKKISQEALIGITYAMASGFLILVVDRLPHGAEHLKEALVGNILFVTIPDVLKTTAVYATVGLVHFIFRQKFWDCSQGNLKSPLWDFIFYFLFGIVITFSTHHAGVLVVFSILVIPAALASRFVASKASRLFLSWGLGLIGVLVAFYLSYKMDLPAGAGIVATLATGFFVILIAKLILEKLRSTT